MTQTIGQRLKAEREEQRLTFEKVFEATRIRIQYLQALEDDDLSVMPSPVQARGYLRNYAEFLGFDVDQVLQGLREMNSQQASTEVIGPGDQGPPSGSTEEPVGMQPAVPTTPESDVIPASVASHELTIPIKPKPARRKKSDTDAPPALAEPPTRRRSRKKADTEVHPDDDVSDDGQNHVEESFPAEEIVAQTAPIERSTGSQEPALQPEPIPS